MASSNEIINIQIGECGNQMGQSWMNNILYEHKIDLDGMYHYCNDGNESRDDWMLSKYYPNRKELYLQRISTYFDEINQGLLTNGYIRNEVENKYKFNSNIPDEIVELCKQYTASFDINRYSARSILIDSDSQSMESIQTSNLKELLNPNNFVVGSDGFQNNWTKGFQSNMADEIMNKIRKSAECCNALQGFQICHSIGGGTGGGITSQLLFKLKDYYPHSTTQSFAICPSSTKSNNMLETYNTVLSMNRLINDCNHTFVIDNDKLSTIATQILRVKEPKYTDLNWIVSLAMANVTSPFRFEFRYNELVTEENSTLRRMDVNLVPFPRLHFLATSVMPIYHQGKASEIYRFGVAETGDRIWSCNRTFMPDIRSEDGKFFSAYGIHRGSIAWRECDDETAKIRQKMEDDYIYWIPNNNRTMLCLVPPVDARRGGGMLANTTAIKTVFQRIYSQFSKIYERKEWIHNYLDQGMEEKDFDQADTNLISLLNQYQTMEDWVIPETDDEDDDEEEDYTSTENDEDEEEESESEEDF